MKLSELEISISVESYDENTAENNRNCCAAESAKLPNYQRYRFQSRYRKTPLPVFFLQISAKSLMHYKGRKKNRSYLKKLRIAQKISGRLNQGW